MHNMNIACLSRFTLLLCSMVISPLAYAQEATSFSIGPDGGVFNPTPNVEIIVEPTDAEIGFSLSGFETTADEGFEELYQEFGLLFDPLSRQPTETHIVVDGDQSALPLTLSARIQVGSNFVDELPREYEPEIIAVVTQSGDNQPSHQIMDIVPSGIDETGSLLVDLPVNRFVQGATDNIREFVFTIAATPGSDTVIYDPVEGRLKTTDGDPPNGCKAFPIVCPVEGGCTVTSAFGPRVVNGEAGFHYGTDYRAPTGTNILSGASGKVWRSYVSKSFGEAIVVEHTTGGKTVYAHLQSRGVSTEDPVQAGQGIGVSNNTGRSFGSHLHLQYVPSGCPFRSCNKSLIDPHACIDP